MKCPVDATELVMSDRQNIEIDYCPTCRGVWLDRGELDKIIERSAGPAPSHQPPAPQSHPQTHHVSYDDDYKHNDSHNYNNHHQPHHKKRESFLGDIFDF